MFRSIAVFTLGAAVGVWAAPAAAEPIARNPFYDSAGFAHAPPTGLGDPPVFFNSHLSRQERTVLAAREALRDGRYAEAADMLDGMSLTHMPGANQIAGLANAGAGRLPEAEQYLERALVRDARDSVATATLGLVRLQLGKRTEAEELLRTLQKRQQRCATACERAAEIDRATEVLARALG